MFEYLMPLLVMPTYENTLLDQTCKAAVERQIEYGKQRGVPWGISESGYNAIDVHLNYQYRAFGVPGLGLKRGLAEDLVIAPYASALALMVAPEEACLNLQRLAAEGFEGQYGFYEAIDYTPSRLPRGQSSAVVRSFMAHHQGMSFLSLAYLLLDRPMQKRFESDPLFQATMLLLQERIPKATAFYVHTAELSDITCDFQWSGDAGARFQQPRHADTGSAVVVERQIPRDDHQRGRRLQPLEGHRRHPLARRQHLRQLGHVLLPPRRGERGVLVDRLSADAQAIRRITKRFSRKGGPSSAAATTTIDTHTEIVVSPEDDIELRRITHHQPRADAQRRSTSRVTRKWSSHRLPRTRCIRRSAISLFRPRSSASGRRSSALAGPAPSTSRRPGCFT